MPEYQPRRALQVLSADARNRAVRTLYGQLLIDVILALVLVLGPVLSEANSFGDFEWQALAFLVVKTILSTLFAYVLRRYLDASGVPTPLPPEYTGEPNEENEHA